MLFYCVSHRIVPLDLHGTIPRFDIMSGRKRSSCFAITLNHVEFDKTCLGVYWSSAGLIRRFAAGEEAYHPPLNPITGDVEDDIGGRHQHIFVEFVEKYFLLEVRDMVIEFLGGDEERSIDVQCCKSPKSWIIYLSKDDYCPYLIGVRVSELSLYARAKHHAKNYYRTIRPIDKSDPFIVGSGQNSRFVIGIIEEHFQELRRVRAINRLTYTPNMQCGVVRDILENMAHIYIEGPPGYGKTELIDHLVKSKKVWKAGEPSNFLFGTLDESYEIIWFEDFHMLKYDSHLSTILSLMDSKLATISKKGCDDRTIIFKGRFIFTSNFPIGDYPMLRRRVTEIYTNHQLYSCLGCRPDYVPPQQYFDITGGELLLDIDNLNNIFTDDELDTL